MPAMVLYNPLAFPDVFRDEIEQDSVGLGFTQRLCLDGVRFDAPDLVAVIENALYKTGLQHFLQHDPHRLDVDLVRRNVAQAVGMYLPALAVQAHVNIETRAVGRVTSEGTAPAAGDGKAAASPETRESHEPGDAAVSRAGRRGRVSEARERPWRSSR